MQGCYRKGVIERPIEYQQSDLRQWHLLNQNSDSFLQFPHPENWFLSCFSQFTVLDIFLAIPTFKTHSFKHYFTCWGYSSEQTRQDSCLIEFPFYTVIPLHPKSKPSSSPSKHIPHSFLEKPDTYLYMNAQIKHFFEQLLMCQRLYNDE